MNAQVHWMVTYRDPLIAQQETGRQTEQLRVVKCVTIFRLLKPGLYLLRDQSQILWQNLWLERFLSEQIPSLRRQEFLLLSHCFVDLPECTYGWSLQYITQQNST